MVNYAEFVTWSPILGGECARISMVNGQGEEYYCLLPFEEGRAFVELRKKALDVLGRAIEADMGAGEYRWR